MSGGGPDWSGALLDWHVDPALALALAVTAGAYLAAAARARRWPRRRTASFLLGLALVGVALGSGLAAGDDTRLSFHMAEHLLIVTAAPPLLLLGAPVRLALLTLPPTQGAALSRALGGRLVRTLLHPFVAWLVFGVVLVGTHVPAFYEAALASGWLHGVEHALYFWSSVLLWQAVLAVAPSPHRPSPIARMLLVMATAPPMVLLGATLTGGTDAVYAPYADALGPAAALADQQTAGALMWLGGSLPMALALVVVGWVAVLREEAREVARERFAERRTAPGGGVG